MKFFYLSNLYVNLNGIPKFKKSKDSLILAGNVGNPYDQSFIDFFSYINRKFNKVFYVIGMYEYQYENIRKTNQRIKELIRPFKNIILLDRTSWILDDILIAGATLWSKTYSVENCIYRYDIPETEYQDLFFSDFTYLKYIKDQYQGQYSKIIFVTHFCPSYKLLPERIFDPCMYASELDTFDSFYRLVESPISYWISGKSPINSALEINGVYCGNFSPDETNDLPYFELLTFEEEFKTFRL